LVKDEKVMKNMVKWIKKDIVKDIIGLWEWVLEERKGQYKKLIKLLKAEGKI